MAGYRVQCVEMNPFVFIIAEIRRDLTEIRLGIAEFPMPQRLVDVVDVGTPPAAECNNPFPGASRSIGSYRDQVPARDTSHPGAGRSPRVYDRLRVELIDLAYHLPGVDIGDCHIRIAIIPQADLVLRDIVRRVVPFVAHFG